MLGRELFRTDDERLENWLDQAEKKLNKGDTNEAIKFYESLKLIEPDNVNVKIGEAYARAKNNNMLFGPGLYLALNDAFKELSKRGVDKTFVDFGMECIGTYYKFLSKEEKEYLEYCNGDVKSIPSALKSIENSAYNWRSLYTSEQIQTNEKASRSIGLTFLAFGGDLLSFSSLVDSFVGYFEKPEQFDIGIYKELKKKLKDKEGVLNNHYLINALRAFKGHVGSETQSWITDIIKDHDSKDDCIRRSLEKVNACITACEDCARAKYWEEHAEEKKALEEKRSSLERQIEIEKEDCEAKKAETDKEISEKQSEIKAAEDKAAEDNRVANDKVSALEKEKAGLGLFKFKEKKEAKARIEEAIAEAQKIRRAGAEAVEKLEDELAELKSKKSSFDKAFEKEKESLKKEIKAIDTELTKNRT